MIHLPHLTLDFVNLALGFAAGLIVSVAAPPVYNKVKASYADFKTDIAALDAVIADKKAVIANTAPAKANT